MLIDMSEIRIIPARNGATVIADRFHELDSEETTVYEFDDNNLEGLVELLQSIVEMIGPMYYDKWDKETTRIVLKQFKLHGHKVSCNEKNCKLCKAREFVESLERFE